MVSRLFFNGDDAASTDRCGSGSDGGGCVPGIPHLGRLVWLLVHGPNWHGIGLARDMLIGGGMTKLDLMTNDSERFHHTEIIEAIHRAEDKDSLKVIINRED